MKTLSLSIAGLAFASTLLFLFVAWAVDSPKLDVQDAQQKVLAEDLAPVTQELDRHLTTRWRELGLEPSSPADELTVLRRLSLALHGTIPSLEEIRVFESDDRPDRLRRWTIQLLDDPRFADYFAERLARSYVGVEGGQFLVFRRDRFVDWLGGQLEERVPYDEIVRSMISERGLWTGNPPTNFVTAAVVGGNVDENKLAGRAVRAFLGQRIDCAQCHDHPFDKWTQTQFEGLAAHFGQTKISPVGVEDKSKEKYEIDDGDPEEKRTVEPAVPFHPEWLPKEGTRREKLAGWITHPENRRFERAAANRVWGLMFGRPYTRPERPVDDIPDPGTRADSAAGIPDTELLDLLGRDFREHGYDLRRLIQVVASSRAFRLSSKSSERDEEMIDHSLHYWALFPMHRLRPEQVIGAMLQSASVSTIDRNSHLVVRMIRFFRENDFVREYGDLGEEELEARSLTIPQSLLRMNGNLSSELSEATPFTAAGRIGSFAGSDEERVEGIYLVCLTRRPTDVEREYFVAQLQEEGDERRKAVMEDLMWGLFNSAEFSLNR